jgi:general secretion pathway protein F
VSTFEYRAYDARGRCHRGLVEAAGRKDARENMARRGLLVESLSGSRRRESFPRARRALVYREIGALLAAGLPLVKALDQLLDSPEMKEVRLLLAAVRDRVKEGAALSVAVREEGRVAAGFEIAVMEAAERTAAMPVMLQRLGDFLEEQEALSDSVRTAMLYPGVVAAFGILLAVLMLGWLLPWTRTFFDVGDAPLPPLTRAMLATGGFLRAWGLPLLAAGVIGGALWRRRLRSVPAARAAWERWLLKVPLAGRGYALLIALRFARSLGVLLSGGVPVVEALAMAGRATGSAWVAGMCEAEAEAVRHGERLSNAIARVPPLAAPLAGWIRMGEAGAGLGELMERAGERLQAQWQRFVRRALALLEPTLLIAIGGFVLLVALSVLMPMLQMTQALGTR